MSIEQGLYATPEQLETEYTGFPELVYSLPLKSGWEDVEPVTFEPYVPPVPQIQPIQQITEITRVVETIYKEADYEPLTQMEFKPAMPETYGTMGYFAVLLSILLFGLVPPQDYDPSAPILK